MLKIALTSKPVVSLYNRETYTELHIDASKDGFGAYMMQTFEGKIYLGFIGTQRLAPPVTDC